jgi:thioredoxin 1
MLKQLRYVILGLILIVSIPAFAAKPSIVTPTIKTQPKITLIELGSMRCIPCKMMQPIMAEIEKEYQNKVTVVFHDVWTNEGAPYGQKYGIRVIPTQIFLDRNGKEYFRHEGFFPKDDLIKVLQEKLK